MIVKSAQGDIFDSKAEHIAFAINTEGINDSGFAGVVARNYWPELQYCGHNELGTVLSKTVENKTYHALVCHSLQNGWGDNQAEIICKCFNKIPAYGERIASVAIGNSFVGIMSGANFRQIICGMHDANQELELYSEYSLDEILRVYEEEKAKSGHKIH